MQLISLTVYQRATKDIKRFEIPYTEYHGIPGHRQLLLHLRPFPESVIILLILQRFIRTLVKTK